MKNLFFIFSIIGLMLVFNSCKKDQLEVNQNTDNVQTNARKRGCGMDDHMAKLMQDPEYKRLQAQKLERVKNMVSFRNDCSTPVILPIAVHFQGVTNPDIECLRALAQSQVNVLNNDYQGTNSDILKWTNTAAASFPGTSNGEGCFKFCLASKNHPASSGLSDGQPAVTINATTGDFDANWSGYINIFVQSGTGVLGYSPLGGAGNGDGVVIDATAFGTGSGCGSIVPGSPYDLGRTLTHEMGHYLLLDHIWGAGCGTDDLVSDTPESNEAYYGCPDIGAATCGSTDMHMNYMDYTNDACMYMFSAGQVSRSASYITASLSAVTNNAANVCSESNGNGGGNGGGGDTATCDDGIQNGQETGVDCGGPDCVPCTTPPSGCELTTVELQLVLDNYGSETDWELYDEDLNVVASGNEYEDDQAGTLIEEAFCLEDGCYEFVLYDAYGDGICCDYGEGFLKLLNASGTVIAESDGYFGAYTIIDFCITNGSERNINNIKMTAAPLDKAVLQRSKAQKKK